MSCQIDTHSAIHTCYQVTDFREVHPFFKAVPYHYDKEQMHFELNQNNVGRWVRKCISGQSEFFSTQTKEQCEQRGMKWGKFALNYNL